LGHATGAARALRYPVTVLARMNQNLSHNYSAHGFTAMRPGRVAPTTPEVLFRLAQSQSKPCPRFACTRRNVARQGRPTLQRLLVHTMSFILQA
jgi:hypothetical protein